MTRLIASDSIVLKYTSGGSGGGDVSSSSNIPDNSICRGDGGIKNIQASLTTIDDAGNIDLKDAGLMDTNVTTAIKVGDVNNKTLNSTTKTSLIGVINDHETILSSAFANGFNEEFEFEIIVDGVDVFAEFWALLKGWDSVTTYDKKQAIHYNGFKYRSLITFNINNSPATNPSKWSKETIWDGNLHAYVDGSPILYFLNTTTGLGVDGHAKIQLTAGTANVPVVNYLYAETNGNNELILQASQSLPIGGVAFLGYANIFDSVTTSVIGAQPQQRFTNVYFRESQLKSIVGVLREKLRVLGAVYFRGIEPSLDITEDLPFNSVCVKTTSGVTYQLWPQTFPDYSAGCPQYMILNDPITPFRVIDGLEEITYDAQGVSFASDQTTRIAFEIVGLQNSGTNTISILGILLPNGTYATDQNCINDSNNLSVTSVSFVFRFTTFRICRIPLRRSVTGGNTTYVNLLGGSDVQDRRGFPFGSAGGGGGSSQSTEFSTGQFKLFDSTDPTKIVEVNASNLSPATTRIITIPDNDATIIDESEVVKKDGSTPLDGDWDSGSHKITAETLGSDIATGTAPLTVASTTVVTNLNADKVDGYDFDQSLKTTDSPTFVQLNAGNLRAENNTISSTDIDGNVVVTPNGTGKVVTSKIVKIQGSGAMSATSAGVELYNDNIDYKIGFDNSLGGGIRYNVDVKDAVHEHIFSFGTLGAALLNVLRIRGNGDVYIDGALNVDNLKTDGNDISSTNANGDINLKPNGTGIINLFSRIKAIFATHWASGIFGGTSGTDVAVFGNLNGIATIGAHDSSLSAWKNLNINESLSVSTNAVAINSTVIPTLTSFKSVGIPEYTNNITAKAAGLVAGDFYRTGENVKVVYDV